MVPQDGPPNPVEGRDLFEMDQRMIREHGIGTRYYSREDLEKSGEQFLEGIARRVANGRTNDCMVTVGGTNHALPLWALTTAELEFVEIYLPSRTGGGAPTSINGHPTKFKTVTSMRPGTSSGCGNLALVVWLKQ